MHKVAINGFGRIGRAFLRAHFTRPQNNFSIVAINDVMPIETAVHLLRYDSVHGLCPDITHTQEHIQVGQHTIAYLKKSSPEDLPWSAMNIPIVAECSGRYTTKEAASLHRQQGAQRVLISAPSPDADRMVVFGVNHKALREEDRIVSNASCTTNALAPIVGVIHQHLGISKGFLTTVHAYTADQRLVDSAHKDLRRSRAAAESIIPTSTGAARAIGHIFPDLQGRLDGVSIRVPTANVSFLDISFDVSKKTTPQEINQWLKTASQNLYAGILGFSEEPLVSKDFVQREESVVVDSLMTQVIEGSLVKIFGWYDNEWGFSCRMCDMIHHMVTTWS